MATVILSTLGTIYGGPVGGAIGALVGQQIDQLIIGPGKSHEGPRLKELQLQTSSYGTQVPAILGAMRVAGTVIWSTDLIERRSKSGGSKSRPATINYTYGASFAVALSSHPVERVGRIWADGNLLRGSAGDLKVETGFRFHSGHDDQPVDPLLASAIGLASCPAFRGLAYAVFEDMQLADYGNRIPSLTFELFERDGAVTLSEIACAAAGEDMKCNSTESVAGYALQGADVESALRPLVDSMPVFIRPHGDSLQLVDWFDRATADMTLTSIVEVNGNAVDRPTRTRQPDGKLPSAIAIRHFEPARDYQAGTQQSQSLRSGQNIPVLELPAANGVAETKRFAELALLQMQRGRDGFAANSLTGLAASRIGDWLITPTHRHRITEIEKFQGWERIESRDWLGAEPALNTQTEAGISISPTDGLAGETHLILVDLPNLTQTDAGAPQIFAAAAGTGSAWRRANLSVRDGGNLIDLGGTAQPAIIGKLMTPLPVHQPYLIDWRNKPVVRLINSGMVLPYGDNDPVSRSAPTISINGDIIRYGWAEFLGGTDYRLHGLVRGLGGSDDKIVPHPVGTPMLLLDLSAMSAIDPGFAIPGNILTVEATGLADIEPVSTQIMVEANAVRPSAPVSGRILKQASGDILIRWIRRNRIDPGWVDEVELPMSEDQLQFDITLFVNGSPLRSWAAFAEQFEIGAAEISALQLPIATLLRFEVRQVGRHARSKPLAISITN
jgi:Putative phage tail protein